MPTRHDRMVVWVFLKTLHIGVDYVYYGQNGMLEEIYKFVFLCVKYLEGYKRFSTHKQFFFSFSFTLHDF